MHVRKWTHLARRVIPCQSCGAVIVAAGSARRMAGVDKIMADLGGEPLLVRTVRAFQETAVVKQIVIVTRPNLIGPVSAACEAAGFSKVKAVITGGDTRQASVQLGLAALSGVRLAAVQDGARPFVTPQLIDRVVRAANTYGAAAPAIGVKDTVKVAKGGLVVRTPDRSTLFAVQTPQAFDFDLLRGALSQAEKDGAAVTDDCSSRSTAAGHEGPAGGGRGRELQGDHPAGPAPGPGYCAGGFDMRIGHGYDVHRLTAGRKLILGGVEIPFELGLEGHSDADVLLHAVMDALLGAAGLGDIGQHFPDTDPRYKGISSRKLLALVGEKLYWAGYEVCNVDVTMIAQRPKLRGYISQMEENIADTLGLDPEQVNVKATTEEGLGFTGAGEGMACHAVCLLERL